MTTATDLADLHRALARMREAEGPQEAERQVHQWLAKAAGPADVQRAKRIRGIVRQLARAEANPAGAPKIGPLTSLEVLAAIGWKSLEQEDEL